MFLYKGISFLTWSKYDKTDYKKLELNYEEIELELKGNNIDKPVIKKIEAALVDETYKIRNPKDKKEYIELEKLVIKNGNKHSGVLTNDDSRSIEELVKAMCFRWREEKSFEVETKYRGLNDLAELYFFNDNPFV